MLNNSTSGTLRVGFEKSMREMYERLTSGTDPVVAPFRTMKDLFMLAVCRGYQLGERQPLEPPKESPIHWEVFSDQVDIPLLKALAIAETGDVSVLMRPDEIALIAEEYANAGIRDIGYNLTEQPGQTLWNLVGLLREEGST